MNTYCQFRLGSCAVVPQSIQRSALTLLVALYFIKEAFVCPFCLFRFDTNVASRISYGISSRCSGGKLFLRHGTTQKEQTYTFGSFN